MTGSGTEFGWVGGYLPERSISASCASSSSPLHSDGSRWNNILYFLRRRVKVYCVWEQIPGALHCFHKPFKINNSFPVLALRLQILDQTDGRKEEGDGKVGWTWWK